MLDCEYPPEDVEITDVTADSRKAGKGTLFVSIQGHTSNGNDFIEDAVRRGAAAVLTDSMPDRDVSVPCILTDDTRRDLSLLCARLYGIKRADGKTGIVAVTGTNGKTTTAHMIAHLLSSSGYKVGVIGTVGNGFYSGYRQASCGMTTPEPEQLYREIGKMSADGADYIVLEVSSHGIYQRRLSGLSLTGCELSAAVFTNLSPEHMDLHPTMEDYYLTKTKLFTDYGFERRIINADDEYGQRLCYTYGGISVGESNDALCRAKNITFLGEDGVHYVCSSPTATLNVKCPMPGTYTVSNSMLAVTTALSLGADAMTVAEAMQSFSGVKGRMERIDIDKDSFVPPVFIDFAHTPAALEALIYSVRTVFPEKRIVVLFGCGGDRDRTKRAVMGRIATRDADLTVITSDNSRTERSDDIINDIMMGVLPSSAYSVIKDRKKAIEYVIMNADDDDVIVLAGKGHEDYEDVNGEKRFFDERRIVLDAIEKRNG